MYVAQIVASRIMATLMKSPPLTHPAAFMSPLLLAETAIVPPETAIVPPKPPP